MHCWVLIFKDQRMLFKDPLFMNIWNSIFDIQFGQEVIPKWLLSSNLVSNFIKIIKDDKFEVPLWNIGSFTFQVRDVR